MSGEDRCTCCELPIYSCGKSKQDRQRWDEQQERAALPARPHTTPIPYRCGAG